MIDRSKKDWTRIEWELTEIVSRLREAAKQNKGITSSQVRVAKPIPHNIMLKDKAPIIMIRRLSKRLSSAPVTGRVSIRPIGSANKTAPNCASFRWSCCWMVGILDAQVENPNPETKKKIATIILIRPGESRFSGVT